VPILLPSVAQRLILHAKGDNSGSIPVGHDPRSHSGGAPRWRVRLESAPLVTADRPRLPAPTGVWKDAPCDW
jgi:hypothetical protein